MSALRQASVELATFVVFSLCVAFVCGFMVGTVAWSLA